MNELEQLKAKYQELGAVIERMEKGEAEFKPLKDGFMPLPLSGTLAVDRIEKTWAVMPTIEEAERLGKIFQAVAEQEHLIRHLNNQSAIADIKIEPRQYHLQTVLINPLQAILGSYRSLTFYSKEIAEKAVKLASPNLLAYWKGEL